MFTLLILFDNVSSLTLSQHDFFAWHLKMIIFLTEHETDDLGVNNERVK